MRTGSGFAIALVVSLGSAPSPSPAQCPLMGAVNTTCETGDSSIESCTASIWNDFENTSGALHGLAASPRGTDDRGVTSVHVHSAILPAVRTLGASHDYNYRNYRVACDGTWDGVDHCELHIRLARHGLELLAEPELVANLTLAARDRLKRSFLAHEAQYRAQLDRIAAFDSGDPSQLCNATYSSVGSCARAVAADRKALREQVYPMYRCDRLIPGQFVTAKDIPDAPGRIVPPGLTFASAEPFFRDRLREEKALLDSARHPR